MDPNFAPARGDLGPAYDAKGDFWQALKEMLRYAEIAKSTDAELWPARADARSGQKQRAREMISSIAQSPAQGAASPQVFAVAYLAIDQKEEAFEWLRRGCKSALAGSADGLPAV